MSLLKELSNSKAQCSLTIANVSGSNYWSGGCSGYVANQGSTNNVNGDTSSSNVVGYFVIYPNYFVYEVSNLTTYFILLTIHNGLNESVTISNITLSINGADPVNASITLMSIYPSNSGDDVMIALFPGSDLGYITSLGNYFTLMAIYFNETLPINITSVGISIVYEYGNNSIITSYEFNIGENLNNI